ncbi:metallophosphoesterase [Bradyrhizobium sp. dw_78]|uniref:metallophosphoesterase family protein n=1 Tax=Bradyrhizobium sp. dw_78 TaxID=2719793 RepID=UPI001BD274B5|nr:metallophosphoesterase [Bradyrhizobium sp. dw_78]
MARAARTRLPQPVFHEPVFGEDGSLPDPTGFSTAHGSDNALYKQIGDLAKKDVVAIPKSRIGNDGMFSLAAAYGSHGPQIVRKITDAGKIVFHSLGDSGASNAGKYPKELRVADQVTLDCASAAEADRAAFLYHLGDVVYNFGEARYYYDQFYEPFRNYPAPIFAIPGNHDSFVIPGTKPADAPLTTFQRNFCATQTVITPEAGSLHRTAMTQPGVYFTLDAPFVRIIGLFSNALEDPGVISGLDKTKKWPVTNIQIDFLRAQLTLIKQQKYAGAVLLATHHPAFSYSPPDKDGGSGGDHGCSTAMQQQIDAVCHEVGVYPHAFLSGHAHNYQRYTRIMNFGGREIDVPFIVCGDGGHNANNLVRARRGKPAQEPNAGADVGYLEGKGGVADVKHLFLAKYDDHNYGYLRIHVDRQYLKIGFHQVGARSLAQSRYDMVTVRLADRHMVAN